MALRRLLVRDKYCPPNMRPLTIDDVTGIRTYYEDLPGDEVRLVSVQPTDAILEENAKDRYDARGTLTRRGKWGATAARVPVHMLAEWKRHANGEDLDPDDAAKAVRANLNSNEFAKLRIAEFTL